VEAVGVAVGVADDEGVAELVSDGVPVADPLAVIELV
jgi:hypothetical protein